MACISPRKMPIPIIHRGTGVVLYFGTVLLAWWFLGERLRTIQYVGVALALGGVAAIVA